MYSYLALLGLVFFPFLSAHAAKNSGPVVRWPRDCAQQLVRDSGEFTEFWNQRLSQKYPFLKEVTDNPQAFKREVEADFERQKKITPEDPLQFSYYKRSFVPPELKQMRRMLQEEVALLLRKRRQIEEVNGFALEWVEHEHRLIFSKEKRLHRLDLGLEFLRDVLAEVEGYLQKEDISYRDYVYLSHFYSRAIGYFDVSEASTMDRALLIAERKIQGFVKMSIEDELEAYRRRDFSFGRTRSINKSVAASKERFIRDFEDKNELKFVMIFSHAGLGSDILHRLMGQDIYFIGLSAGLFGADGFNRPPGLHAAHDVGHSALIHWTLALYMERNNVTPEQKEKLNALADKIHFELRSHLIDMRDRAKASGDDRAYQYSRILGRLFFNVHHDRGYPLLPSIYLTLNKIPRTAYLLYFLLEKTGHGVHMPRGSREELNRAFEELRSFFLKFKEEEAAILGKDPVPRGKPEDFIGSHIVPEWVVDYFTRPRSEKEIDEWIEAR